MGVFGYVADSSIQHDLVADTWKACIAVMISCHVLSCFYLSPSSPWSYSFICSLTGGLMIGVPEYIRSNPRLEVEFALSNHLLPISHPITRPIRIFITMAAKMQHIEASSLEDLPSRIAYLSSFLDLNASDGEALQAAKPLVAPLIPSILEAVYIKLLSFDITAQAFVPKNTDYEGEVVKSVQELTLSHPQIALRKDFLKVGISWLGQGLGLSGETDCFRTTSSSWSQQRISHPPVHSGHTSITSGPCIPANPASNIEKSVQIFEWNTFT